MLDCVNLAAMWAGRGDGIPHGMQILPRMPSTRKDGCGEGGLLRARSPAAHEPADRRRVDRQPTSRPTSQPSHLRPIPDPQSQPYLMRMPHELEKPGGARLEQVHEIAVVVGELKWARPGPA